MTGNAKHGFRPYLYERDDIEGIHNSSDNQNKDRNGRLEMIEDSKHGTSTADECYEDADSIDSEKEGNTNQGQGSLTSQTCGGGDNNSNLDEKDANDSLEERKYDTDSENDDYRSDTSHCCISVYSEKVSSYFLNGYERQNSFDQQEFSEKRSESENRTQPVSPLTQEDSNTNMV